MGESVRIHLLAAVAAVAALAGSAAQAITYNFESIPRGTAAVANYAMTVDGLTLNVRAGTFASGGNATTGNGELIEFSGRNYGIGERGLGLDRRGIDGRGTQKDVMVFDFGARILLESITFGYYDHNGVISNFLLFGLNGSNLVGQGGATAIPGGGVFAFLPAVFGQSFGIGAPGELDRFKIKAITVSTVAPVPLPAALPLFGVALLAIGAIRRRRYKTA